MYRTALITLAVVACVQARPQLVVIEPSSSGQSNSGITKGETVLPTGEVSTITQEQSATGGEAVNGGFNVGSALTNTQSLAGLLGTSSTSNTDAKSQQGSIPAFGNFGSGFALPSVPAFPGFGASTAQGQAGSSVTKGETIGPHGGSTTIEQQQSGTGGEATNGGTNTGSASSNSQSQSGLLGTSSSTNTNAQSVQNTVPTFGSIGGSIVLPSIPVFPGFGPSAAKGQAGSSVTKGETIGPFGVSTTIAQQQSGAGGQAANGGFSTGSANSNSQSQSGLEGTSSSSNTNAESNQGSIPTFGNFGGVVLPAIPVFPGFGPSSAQGQAGSSITKGETIGPFGASNTVTTMQSGTGGQAVNGGVNSGTASSSSQSQITPHGTSSSSNTDAQSVQLGGAAGLPGLPVIPGFGLGSATGNAGSQLTQGKTTGPDGSSNTVTSLSSSAGGSAQNGGTSVSHASGSTSSIDNIHGSQTQSNLDSQSTQTGR